MLPDLLLTLQYSRPCTGCGQHGESAAAEKACACPLTCSAHLWSPAWAGYVLPGLLLPTIVMKRLPCGQVCMHMEGEPTSAAR